jgi:uncharacterized protein
MYTPHASIQRFLAARVIAVAGVSRDPQQAANHIYRRLRDTRAGVVAVNPRAERVEGDACHASLAAVPGGVEAVLVATAPAASLEVAKQCAAAGVRSVWFHRSLGAGSVSSEAVEYCRSRGIETIVGGCPMMVVGEVDGFHACLRWLLTHTGGMPA